MSAHDQLEIRPQSWLVRLNQKELLQSMSKIWELPPMGNHCRSIPSLLHIDIWNSKSPHIHGVGKFLFWHLPTTSRNKESDVYTLNFYVAHPLVNFWPLIIFDSLDPMAEN